MFCVAALQIALEQSLLGEYYYVFAEQEVRDFDTHLSEMIVVCELNGGLSAVLR